MAQQQHDEGPAAATPVWLQQMQSYNSEELAGRASELGLQSCNLGGSMDQVVDAGTIPSLVGLLSRSDTKAQEHAVSLLMGLTESSDNIAAIVAAGAVPALVGLLQSDSPITQNMAAMTLYGVADCSSNRAMIISAGAIPLLEELCGSDAFSVRLAAGTALCRVAADNSQYEALLATCALPMLITFLTCDSSSSTSRASAGNAKGASTQAAEQDGEASSSAIMPDDQEELSWMGLESVSQIGVLHAMEDSLLDTSYYCADRMLFLLMSAGLPEVLVAVLKKACSAVQWYAIQLLSQMMYMDRDAATGIAAAGAIQALLPVLQQGDAGTQERAATALCLLISESEENKAAFVTDNGLAASVTLMGIPGKQQYAMQLLNALVSDGKGSSASSSIVSAAMAAGVVEPLVQLLQGSDYRVTDMAMSVLSLLAKHSSSNQVAIVAAGAVPALVSLLRSTHAGYNAAVVLMDLTHDNSSNKAALLAAGGIRATVEALSSREAELQEVSAALLHVMVSSGGNYQSAAITAGAIPALVSVLKGRNLEAQIVAAGALANLAFPAPCIDVQAAAMANLPMPHTSSEVQPSHIGVWHAAAEAVPVLVSLLKHHNVELLHAVSAALCNMFQKSSAFAQAFKAADGLTAVVSMLNSGREAVQLAAGMLLRSYNKSTDYGRLG